MLNKYLTSNIYDPEPHRFKPEDTPVSQRNIPILYTCSRCTNKISFKPEDFEKHNDHTYSNLDQDQILIFNYFTKVS